MAGKRLLLLLLPINSRESTAAATVRTPRPPISIAGTTGATRFRFIWDARLSGASF